MKLGLVEIALIELVIFLLLWVVDEFTASLLCVIIPVICLAVLIIAMIAEWLEPSKVPRLFFTTLGVTIIIPLITLGVYLSFFGRIEWMTQ